MSAYTNLHITVRFDGTQVDENTELKDGDGKPQLDDNLQPKVAYYPDLRGEQGDDVWVTFFNPMLMPPSKLLPTNIPPHDAAGNVTDLRAALNAGQEVCAGLITGWHVYDLFAAEPTLMPIPVTPDLLERVPAAVGNAVAGFVDRARNPH